MLTKEGQAKVDAAWAVLKDTEMTFSDFWQVVNLLDLESPHFQELHRRWRLHTYVISVKITV